MCQSNDQSIDTSKLYIWKRPSAVRIEPRRWTATGERTVRGPFTEDLIWVAPMRLELAIMGLIAKARPTAYARKGTQ